jgi:hypothetical protein
MPVFVQEYMPGGAWTGVLETELVVFVCRSFFYLTVKSVQRNEVWVCWGF